jgi:hypothetical protein
MTRIVILTHININSSILIYQSHTYKSYKTYALISSGLGQGPCEHDETSGFIFF